MAEVALYTPPEHGELVTVRCLAPDDVTPEFGLAALDLKVAAYGEQLGRQFFVPHLAFQEEYLGGTPTERDEHIERSVDDMLERLEDGGQCAVVYDEDGTLVSLATVSVLGEDRGLHIDDILTSRSKQFHGFGSCVTHAALSAFDKPDETNVSLEAFSGSEVNNWYLNLGFNAPFSSWRRRTMKIGGYTFNLINHSGSLGGIKEMLELRSGKPVTS